MCWKFSLFLQKGMANLTTSAIGFLSHSETRYPMSWYWNKIILKNINIYRFVARREKQRALLADLGGKTFMCRLFSGRFLRGLAKSIWKPKKHYTSVQLSHFQHLKISSTLLCRAAMFDAGSRSRLTRLRLLGAATLNRPRSSFVLERRFLLGRKKTPINPLKWDPCVCLSSQSWPPDPCLLKGRTNHAHFSLYPSFSFPLSPPYIYPSPLPPELCWRHTAFKSLRGASLWVPTGPCLTYLFA